MNTLLLFLFTVSAQADLPKPCKVDIEKFCSGPDVRIGQCLKEHESELSPECKSKVQKRDKAKNKDQTGLTDEDCKDVKYKDPNFKACMKRKIEAAKERAKAYRDEKLKERQIKLDEKKAAENKPAEQKPSH